MTTLTVFDEITGKGRGEPIVLEFLTDEITVRDLIRERVYQDVKDFNLAGQDVFQGLVQPTDSEQTSGGFRLKERRTIDWQPQFEKACEAFQENRILVLVDDRQTESLDERFLVGPQTEVTFLKLVPLVGG
ncbi:MAG: hypothetical protein R3C10_24900 [Pirellulales bacterium]|nr:hypothetical protein [Planctomycetales bacterium]